MDDKAFARFVPAWDKKSIAELVRAERELYRAILEFRARLRFARRLRYSENRWAGSAFIAGDDAFSNPGLDSGVGA